MQEHMRLLAIGALLLGVGCGGRDADAGPREDMQSEHESVERTPTWHADVAPIVTRRCVTCHVEGGIAPFSLRSYERARPFAAQIASAVEAGRMPPYLAEATPECTPRHPYANDPRLTIEEKAVLRAWADTGAAEGDAATAAPLPTPPSRELEREDVVMRLPQPIRVAHDAHRDIHTCVVVDPQLSEDSYVIGRQITPGNAKVVHHAVTYMLKPQRDDAARTQVTRAEMLERLRNAKGVGVGERYDCFGGPGLADTGLVSENLASWAPGAMPTLSPHDSGQPMKRDSLVIMDLHYHASHGDEEDATTSLALMLAKTRPGFISQPLLIGNFAERLDLPSGFGELVAQPGEDRPQFLIPAGASHHVEEMTWTWRLPNAPSGIRAYFAGTHMHYVGRDMQVFLENTRPVAGELARECLVQTPRWDFNWQRGYEWAATYEQLPLMNPGDVLRMRCVYDNSLNNPALAAALAERGLTQPVDVALGEDTLDEMCSAVIGIIYPNQQP